jgi:(+)-pinoresinol hydroxylase
MNVRKIALCGGLLLGHATVWSAPSPSISWTLFPDSPTVQTVETDPGRREFQRACAVCHAAEPDRPGTMSLQFKYAGRLPAALEQRTDLTADAVRYIIRHGIAMMPSFRQTELSDTQVAAIAAYLSRKRSY